MFFFSSRRRHTRFDCDWSSDVCSSDLPFSLSMLPGATDRIWEFSFGYGFILAIIVGVLVMIPILLGIDRIVYQRLDRKSTRLNSSHSQISYAVFCLKKKKHAYTWMRVA